MRRKRTTAEPRSTVSPSQRRWIIGFFLGLEAVFVLLGWCFIFIGNGLIIAILPLLAAVLSKRSERQSFKRPTFGLLVSNVAVVSLLVGAGVWFLVDLGFEAQNLICIASRS